MIILREERNVMNSIANYLIPFFVIFIIIYAFAHKLNVYDSFLKGAKEGIALVFDIAPTIVGMVLAINIFINSSVIQFVLSFLTPFFNKLSIPLMIIPMALIRPISGTATLAIMSNILATYGPDSFVGNLASILQGCTDTTIYVLALYFGSVGVVKTKHALTSGLIADFFGILMAFLISYIFFR